MFDIGWPEMLIVGMIALFVVGPKELPHVLMTMSRYWRKIRGVAMDFRGQFDDMIREAELDDIRKEVDQVGKLDISSHLDLDVDLDLGLDEAGSKKNNPNPKSVAAPQTEPKQSETQSEATESRKPESEA